MRWLKASLPIFTSVFNLLKDLVIKSVIMPDALAEGFNALIQVFKLLFPDSPKCKCHD